jgi:hypothetical protein
VSDLALMRTDGQVTRNSRTHELDATEDRLLEAMATTSRGPRQNGLFALWLFVRQCAGALPPDALSERAFSGRFRQLERRLSSLSLPAPLRRALPGSFAELATGERDRVPIALQQLAAPARDAIGTAAGDIMSLAARRAQRAANRELSVASEP